MLTLKLPDGSARQVAPGLGVVTVTGTGLCRVRSTRPAQKPRQLKTWLAFTPCARATSATLAPGSSVNCTI